MSSTLAHEQVACDNCNRGGRGNDQDKCSAGWMITDVNSNGCFSGTPIVGDPQPPPKLTRSQKRYRMWLKAHDALGISFGEFIRNYNRICDKYGVKP